MKSTHRCLVGSDCWLAWRVGCQQLETLHFIIVEFLAFSVLKNHVTQSGVWVMSCGFANEGFLFLLHLHPGPQLELLLLLWTSMVCSVSALFHPWRCCSIALCGLNFCVLRLLTWLVRQVTLPVHPAELLQHVIQLLIFIWMHMRHGRPFQWVLNILKKCHQVSTGGCHWCFCVGVEFRGVIVMRFPCDWVTEFPHLVGLHHRPKVVRNSASIAPGSLGSTMTCCTLV